MKFKILMCLFVAAMISGVSSRSYAQAVTVGDTTWITGGTFAGGENIGVLDSVINNDTTSTGARVNVNRVYALYEGQVYYQKTPIYCNNPTGTLTIVGVPDPNNTSAKAKPIILLQPTGSVEVGINRVYGSIKMVNIHYQVMEMDGYIGNSELFYCGTSGTLKQTLTIDKCFFEFSNIDLFDCTNESGAIGGWPYGASFFITNSYFRNMFYSGQWWGSRVFQCKHPTDTLWVENCTVTTGGLTFLQQNELSDFVYINHNTIVNNKKYWLLSPYRHNEFITNNIFVNQDWVGEDTNVTNSGQDPDKLFMSTIDIDTNNATNGLVVQPKYMVGGDTANIDQTQLGLNKLKIFVSNNINFYDPLLISNYYQSSTYILADTGSPAQTFNAIPSYLGWFYKGARPVKNMPGAWMNSRTQALFDAYKPPNGGFVEQNTITTNPNTTTPVTMSAAVIDAMAQWNQNQYGDSRFATPTPTLTSTAYIYGDYDATTLPGIVGGSKTDAITQSTTIGSGDQVGISKFTDLTENFSQSTHVSTIDNLPIGALMWDDTQNAAYVASEATGAPVDAVWAAYNNALAVKDRPTQPMTFTLAQNYPNPFNPTTQINYTVPNKGYVTLKVFNVLGQEVATLYQGQQTAGQHFVNFDGSKLASGVYFYRLQQGSNSITQKMMLLK